MESEIIRTARHEAGHAVMALTLGIPIEYVTIQEDQRNLGHVRFSPSKWAGHWRIANKCASNEEIVQRALVDAAGCAAELIYDGCEGNVDYWGPWELQEGTPGTDWSDLQDLGIRTDKQIYQITRRAKQILDRKSIRPYLDQVAFGLPDHGTLQDSELDRIKPDKRLSDWTTHTKLAKKIFN